MKLTVLCKDRPVNRLLPSKTLLIMKLTAFLLATCLQLSANGFSQKITISEKNAPLEKVFKEIEKQSEYLFWYEADLLGSDMKVTISVRNAHLEKVLQLCLENQPLTYSILGKTVVVKRKPVVNIFETTAAILEAIPPPAEVKGKVVDETGKPVSGATVMVKGTNNGTQTDAKGEFVLNNIDDNAVLEITAVGHSPQTITVSGRKSLNITLKTLVLELDETVVIAYGTSKIKDVTGSISHIGTRDIKNAPMGSTIESILQGKAAGVNVVIQSASPTSPISVIIRGASSLSGDNQPLWVIDGVPQYVPGTSGDIANTLYNLNLNDVESIDILKDASATALYGSRAANGVVIVTTKKGLRNMTPTIELSTRLGWQKMDFNGYEYMEAPEYIRFADAAARQEVFSRGSFDYFTRLYLDEQAFYNLNTSQFDTSDLKILPGAYYQGNTNWMKEMTQNPLTHQYDLSMRGGSNNLAYYVSFFHNQTVGIVKSGRSKLFGGRLNLEARLNKGVKFGINLSGSSRGTDDKDYMLSVLKKVRPDIPAFNDDGTLFTRDPYTENPYTTLRNTQQGSGQVFNGTGYLEWAILNGLLLKTTYTADYVNSQFLDYKRRGSTFNYNGSRDWSNTKSTGYVWENTINLVRTYGKHDILALGGFSMERHNALTYAMYASNFPDDDVLNDFGSAATIGSLTESFSQNSLISEFARVHYKYNNRYIISGTIRRDGSSRFGPDKRWGIFPSGAAAWLISEEDFLKGGKIEDIVSYLKLRVSHGLAGSQNLGNYDWRTRVGSSRYNGMPGIAPNSIGNPELRWEQTLMTDVGLDFGFWNDRIRGSFGFFQKNSKDLIYSKPVAPSSAFSTITSNIASTETKGLEFEIKVDVLKTRDLTVTLDFNAGKNKTKLTKINGVDSVLYFPNSYAPYMKALEGQYIDQWWGYQAANRLFVTQEELIALGTRTASGGVQPYRTVYGDLSKGDLILLDRNMDGVVNANDKALLGSANPKFFGGFGATLYFKNLMVNATFTYSYGNKRLWQMPMSDLGYMGNYNQSNLIGGKSATLLSPYEATMPRMTQYGFGGNGDFSDFWLYDASYVRLSALNLSYRLNEKHFRNMLIQGVDITFQASNLFTLTSYPGFDPQGNWGSSSIGSGMGIDYSYYPAAKNFNLGFKFTFK